MFAGTGGPPTPGGEQPKLVPNERITHADLARLKREEYERRKLAKYAQNQEAKDEYNHQMRQSEELILNDMKGSK